MATTTTPPRLRAAAEWMVRGNVTVSPISFLGSVSLISALVGLAVWLDTFRTLHWLVWSDILVLTAIVLVLVMTFTGRNSGLWVSGVTFWALCGVALYQRVTSYPRTMVYGFGSPQDGLEQVVLYTIFLILTILLPILFKRGRRV